MEPRSIPGVLFSKQDVDHSTGSPIVDRFSVLEGGPIYRFQMAVGLAIPTILPMIPMLILATPTDQLVRTMLKLLV
jgi:hypothetical protein